MFIDISGSCLKLKVLLFLSKGTLFDNDLEINTYNTCNSSFRMMGKGQ